MAHRGNLIGQTIAQYRILEKLGEGGMGEVYLAEDRSLGRQVAIKVLPPRSAHRPINLERFSREANAIGSLNHPNIVTIHAVEEIGGLRLIVMERVEGQNLSSLLPSGGLPAEQYFAIALPLAEAVAAAHARGIIHRDIKPANVMVTHDQRVKVVDFGLAKLRTDMPETGAGVQNTLTQAGHLVGTLTYMSPEQLRGEPADARSDVFALGTVLYEMATGRHPFDGDTQPVVISSILCQDPKPLTGIRAELPEALERIIVRCLAKDPANRYPDARSLHGELVALKGDLDTEMILRRVRKPNRKIGRRGVVAAVIAAGVAGGGLYWLSRTQRAGIESPAPATPHVVPIESTGVTLNLPTVAIVHFQNLRHDVDLEWLSTGLADMLVTDLSQSRAIRVVPSEQMFGTLASRPSGDAVLSAEWIRDIGERVNADTIVSGNFVEVDGELSITFKVHELPSAAVLVSDRLVGRGQTSLFSLIDQLSQRVLAELELGSAPGPANRDLETVTTSSLEALRSYAEGRNLRMQGKLLEAVPLLERAVELDPSFAMAWTRLGVAYRALGRDSEAWNAVDRAYDHVQRLPPRERTFVEAQYYGNRRDRYPEAISAYERVLAIDPDDQTARYNLASLLSFLERSDEAIEHLEALRKSRTEMSGPYMFLAHELGIRGNFGLGLEILEEAARRQPDSFWRNNVLGWHLAMMGRFDEADRSIARAEALRPGDSYTTVSRWHLGMLAEDWAAAERAAEAGRATPDAYGRSNGAMHLAMIRLLQGRARDAEDLFDELLAVNPDDARYVARNRSIIAEMHYELGRYGEALAGAVAAREVAADDWAGFRAASTIALASQALGDPAAASHVVADAYDPDYSNVDRRYRLQTEGRLALARGELDVAKHKLEAASKLLPTRGYSWQLVPDHVVIWDALGRTLEAEGDIAGAIERYRAIAEASTERIERPLYWVRSFYQLGRLYALAGDETASRAAYRRFVELWGDGEIDREAVGRARDALR